ncbi:hypothetical protein [Streptomyces hoynatensis]|uniref:Uncharacterized protein n=1 Tax=Streptomyces hoynatensis TaxID=1141874 RepID=A0A3A9YVZ9_9ACTN|nr:hypothetical protein [Streptomyces hoynatensis]RKN40080.1 hypothetical protein D7294_19400 [Streptomyces hoynatensis]
MSVQALTRLTPAVAAERAALTALADAPETEISGAPVYAPQAAGLALLLILASPKQPSEPRDK